MLGQNLVDSDNHSPFPWCSLALTQLEREQEKQLYGTFSASKTEFISKLSKL